MKKTTNYGRGARAERELRLMLEAQGLYVVRSAGSHGPFDLVAFHPADLNCDTPAVVGYQIKRSTRPLSDPEWDKMIDTATRYGLRAVIARREAGKKNWTLTEVYG